MILLVLKCRLFSVPYLSPLEALPTVPIQDDLCFKLRLSALCVLQPPSSHSLLLILLALNPKCDPSFWFPVMPFPCLKPFLPIFPTSSNPHPTPAFLPFVLFTIRNHMKGLQFSFPFNIFHVYHHLPFQRQVSVNEGTGTSSCSVSISPN